MAKGVTINRKWLTYTKKQVQKLLDRVFNLDFFVELTEEEYEALPESEKKNGNLYLIVEEE